jgi:chromosome segregation ATPase
MNRPTLARRLCLGFLIGVLVTPTQTAQAQWTVFDPSQYALQVKKRLEEAERHVKKFDNAVKQLATLKGVLEKTEDLVAKQRNAITTMSNIGRTVRGVYQLKDQLEAIVISRMGALKSIHERLRNGIFDPEADMRDFEDYLRNSIGRSSQDTVANLQRLMKMDNQLKRMNDDLEMARSRRAATVLLRDAAKNNRNEELAKPESEKCASCIASLNEEMSNCNLLIAHYDSEIARLECQIEDRKKKYNIQMDERVKFGEQVQSMNKAWSRFNDSLDELQRALSKY